MTRLTTELFRTPGIVFDGDTGEQYDLTNILLVNKKGDVFVLPRQFDTKEMYGRFVIGRPNKRGYYQIGIYDENGQKRYPYIHRLVASAWLDRESYQTDVMHKDDNPANNYVDNIEWCSPKENIQDMISKNRDNFYGNKKGKKVCSDETMLDIYRHGPNGLNWKRRHVIAKFASLGISDSVLTTFRDGTSTRLKRYLRNNLVK